MLGGDGTMLRALARFLGTGVPVIGVNFGRVGFLTAIPGDELENGLGARSPASTRRSSCRRSRSSSTASVTSPSTTSSSTSGTLGRMIELGYAIGGEDLGVQPCDGLICATPSGSTAYNLSNGGPVLVWGLDAMVVTFVAPHTLHARPLVVGRGPDVDDHEPDRRTSMRSCSSTASRSASCSRRRRAVVRVGEQPSLLATLPEVTFFRRYGATLRHRRKAGAVAAAVR